MDEIKKEKASLEVSSSKKEGSSKKDSSWLKTRHKVLRFLFGWILVLVGRIKYGMRAERFKQQGKRPYLILYNHQTPFDQFFVMASFKGAIYYLATEDIFSLGWVSSLIRYAVEPIPIKKQSMDLNAVKMILKVAKEGGTIAVAPEGNRTYSGKTEYMNPAIAHLAKKLRLPIALYRIEGGYGVEPRWSDKVRKGRMRAYVSRVIEPEEYKSLSNDELMTLIREGLYVNEACPGGPFKSERQAEYLERCIYVCPDCGFSVFRSEGNEMECMTCHKKVKYNPDKSIEGVGFSFPFRYVNDWYEYQKSYVNQQDTAAMTEEPLFVDVVNIAKVVPYKHKIPLMKEVPMKLYGDRIVITPEKERSNDIALSEDGNWILPFETLGGAAILGRNKLNVYFEETIYQIKGDKHFNALKYMNLYYRFKNITSGERDGKFLGL